MPAPTYIDRTKLLRASLRAEAITQLCEKYGLAKNCTKADIKKAMEEQKQAEMKALATNLALTEMQLNRWVRGAENWKAMYEGVWIMKMVDVETLYNTREILEQGRKLLAGQKFIATRLGVIISNQGKILANQAIIIDNQNQILNNQGQMMGQLSDIQGGIQQLLNAGNTVTLPDGTTYDNPNAYRRATWGKWAIWIGVIIVLFIIVRLIRRARRGKKK